MRVLQQAADGVFENDRLAPTITTPLENTETAFSTFPPNMKNEGQPGDNIGSHPDGTTGDGKLLNPTLSNMDSVTTSANPTSANPTSYAVPAGAPTMAPEPSPSEEASSSGLARGAIIGIAVGCGIAGLILIFGLSWYLLRRHQRKKELQPLGSPYGSGTRGAALMAEKETAADVDVAPHSPYSDDGVPPGAAPERTYSGDVAVAAGGAAPTATPHSHLQDPPQSFTPYTDGTAAAPAAAAPTAGTPSVRAASLAQTDDARVNQPSPVPGRSTPRALTTPYAHLVEEGMTEEEIRRLEEEERQLDAAIAEASRR